MPHFITSFLIGLGFAVVLHVITRIVLGDRADNLPGVAVVIAFFFPPWWAGLAGALLGHIAAVLFKAHLKKENMPSKLTGMAIFILVGYVFASMFDFNSKLSAVTDIAQQSYEQEWAKFSLMGKANNYVAEHYRPCIEAKSYTLVGVSVKYDRSICESSTVSMAAATYDKEFAQSVQAAIAAWNNRQLDPSVDEKIKATMTSP